MKKMMKQPSLSSASSASTRSTSTGAASASASAARVSALSAAAAMAMAMRLRLAAAAAVGLCAMRLPATILAFSPRSSRYSCSSFPTRSTTSTCTSYTSASTYGHGCTAHRSPLHLLVSVVPAVDVHVASSIKRGDLRRNNSIHNTHTSSVQLNYSRESDYDNNNYSSDNVRYDYREASSSNSNARNSNNADYGSSYYYHGDKAADGSSPSSSSSSSSRSRSSSKGGNGGEISPAEMRRIEAEVAASAQARIDRRRVQQSLLESNPNNINNPVVTNTAGPPTADPRLQTTLQSSQPTERQQQQQQQQTPPPSRFSIAVAAGSTTSLLALSLLHASPLITACLFVATAAYASLDPLDDGSSVLAPLARIVGRATLETTTKTTPKVKAAILAATTDSDQITTLHQRIRQLETENAELKEQLKERDYVSDNLGAFTLAELQDYARRHGIRGYSGKGKAQLMRRLLEEGVIRIN